MHTDLHGGLKSCVTWKSHDPAMIRATGSVPETYMTTNVSAELVEG